MRTSTSRGCSHGPLERTRVRERLLECCHSPPRPHRTLLPARCDGNTPAARSRAPPRRIAGAALRSRLSAPWRRSTRPRGFGPSNGTRRGAVAMAQCPPSHGSAAHRDVTSAGFLRPAPDGAIQRQRIAVQRSGEPSSARISDPAVRNRRPATTEGARRAAGVLVVVATTRRCRSSPREGEGALVWGRGGPGFGVRRDDESSYVREVVAARDGVRADLDVAGTAGGAPRRGSSGGGVRAQQLRGPEGRRATGAELRALLDANGVGEHLVDPRSQTGRSSRSHIDSTLPDRVAPSRTDPAIGTSPPSRRRAVRAC